MDDTKSIRTTFLPFLNSGRPGPFPMPSKNTLWLSYLIFELEHEIMEVQTKFWPELLRQLQSAQPKFSMDNAVKVSEIFCNLIFYCISTYTMIADLHR